MSDPVKYDLKPDQGCPFVWEFTLFDGPDETAAPMDLSGYDAQLHVRKHVDDEQPLVDLQVASGITIDGVAGTVRVEFSQAQIAAIAASNAKSKCGPAGYDVKLIPPSAPPEFLAQGSVLVQPRFTRGV